MRQTDERFQEIRAARNSLRSAERAAAGYTSGRPIYNKREAEKRLRELLWRHRDALIDATSEPI